MVRGNHFILSYACLCCHYSERIASRFVVFAVVYPKSLMSVPICIGYRDAIVDLFGAARRAFLMTGAGQSRSTPWCGTVGVPDDWGGPVPQHFEVRHGGRA